MTSETLIQKALDLQQEIDTMKQRVEAWNRGVYLNIERILAAFSKDHHGLSCEVVKPTPHSVALKLLKSPIANSSESQKEGGALQYILDHRGKILVVITYPFVSGQVEQNPPFVIKDAAIEPEEVTKPLIWGHIETFLDKMKEWESGKTAPMGFKIENGSIVLSNSKED